MRAIGFTEFGEPEVLTVLDVPEPDTGEGDIRIRVHAAAVNPSDLVTRSGMGRDRYADVEPPYIPGWEAAGVVEDAGADTGFAVGDEVFAITLPVLDGGGAYQDSVVVPAASVWRQPSGVDVFAASTIAMNGLTALVALALADVDTGDTVAVTGSAGALGGYVIQIAAHRGLRVIADATEADEELVRGFGATEVVRRGDDVAERFRELAPDGVDALVDAAVQGDLVIPALADGGRYLAVRWAGIGGGTEESDRIVRRDIRVADHVRDSGGLQELAALVDEGVLTPRVADVLPAGDAAEAHRRLEAGGLRGRLVLDFR
ncbi:MAG: NADP-dependent oxidoreductase [Gordonia paraffinivorans]